MSEIKKTISSLKDRVDHIVMILHWGGKVGEVIFGFQSTRFSKKMINYGADLVIGHHSHTIQPYEIYKKVHFYSLGNFVFLIYF